MQKFKFNLPVNIIFGPGQIKELSDLLGSHHQRIMIVTDKNLAEKCNAVNAVASQLKRRKVVVFDQVEENPSFTTIEKGRMQARESDVQIIIGIGGGSPMDAAKGIAVLVTNEDSMQKYMNGNPLTKDPLPVVCIPTTSGTGSEVTPYAVFTDMTGQNKGGYTHPKIFPTLSVIDPELTYTMPESVVINTGLDTITHAVEAYLSLDSFPLSDLFALESIYIALNNIRKASQKDSEAMNQMAYASMLAGVAITHGGTILLHVMGYPLTVFHNIPHGLANGILLPEFMNFMRTYSTVKSKIKILDGLFVSVGGYEGFVNNLGISTHLSTHGIAEEEIEKFTSKVIVKSDVKITPARVTENEINQIYRSAF